MVTPKRLLLRIVALCGVVLLASLAQPLLNDPQGPRSAALSAEEAHSDARAASEAEWLEFVGQLGLAGGLHADIWAHKQTAYVGTWSGGCPGTGVKVVDIGEPAHPELLGTLAAHAGTSAEDLVAIEANTAAFQGDLLAVGLQVCGSGGVPGVEFWDVTDPVEPALLGFLPTPGTIGVHELHLFQRDGQVLALLAVPHSDRAGAGGDFRIVDATDPRTPVQIADWGVFQDLGLPANEARGSFPDIFGHSAYVSPDGNTAYVSYWDAGVVLLDISDPSSPRYLGRTTFGPEDEGNAHSVAIDASGRILAQADEVTEVATLGIQVEGSPEVGGHYGAVEASFTPPLASGGAVNAELVYVGRACPAGAPPQGSVAEDPLLADPAGRVALVERGECHFSAKVLRLQGAGAVGVVVANNMEGPPFPMGAADLAQSPAIPAVMIGQADAERLMEALGDGASLSVALSADRRAAHRDWGYLRLYDVSDPARPLPLSTFATAHALNQPHGSPPSDGDYSVHNPVIVGDRLYASWFSDGVRVVDISAPAQPREVAAFVPPAHPDPSGLSLKADQPMVWGVYVHGDLILLSDMNFGLYVLRHLRGAAGTDRTGS